MGPLLFFGLLRLRVGAVFCEVVSYGPYCRGPTNSGISRVGMWAGRGVGEVRVACC